MVTLKKRDGGHTLLLPGPPSRSAAEEQGYKEESNLGAASRQDQIPLLPVLGQTEHHLRILGDPSAALGSKARGATAITYLPGRWDMSPATATIAICSQRWPLQTCV